VISIVRHSGIYVKEGCEHEKTLGRKTLVLGKKVSGRRSGLSQMVQQMSMCAPFAETRRTGYAEEPSWSILCLQTFIPSIY
jgi:hypothetical protein